MIHCRYSFNEEKGAYEEIPAELEASNVTWCKMEFQASQEEISDGEHMPVHERVLQGVASLS